MKYTQIAVLLIALNAYGQGTASKAAQATEALHTLVHTEKAAGAVAGVIKNDTLAWTAALGYRDVKKQRKFTVETPTRIASIAKSMTAIAVMQLYEQGKVGLDTPIHDYIEEFPRNAKGVITVRQLLNHSSGIKGYASVKEAESKKNYATLTDAMHLFMERETEGVPGEVYKYTSYGYVVLGVLIERVTGMSFEAYMKEQVWLKAGMTNTGVERTGETYPNKSELYYKNKRGKVKAVKRTHDLSNRVPGGGFYSTLGDLLNFGQAILNNTLVTAETLEMMLENNELNSKGNPYGFGWFLYGGKTDHAAVFGHGGAQTGAATQIIIIPSSKTVIVALANTGRVGVMGTIIELNDIYKKE